MVPPPQLLTFSISCLKTNWLSGLSHQAWCRCREGWKCACRWSYEVASWLIINCIEWRPLANLKFVIFAWSFGRYILLLGWHILLVSLPYCNMIWRILYSTLHNALLYEKVSDQGPVWVRSEEKIPGVYISTHDINVGLPECSLDP